MSVQIRYVPIPAEYTLNTMLSYIFLTQHALAAPPAGLLKCGREQLVRHTFVGNSTAGQHPAEHSMFLYIFDSVGPPVTPGGPTEFRAWACGRAYFCGQFKSQEKRPCTRLSMAWQWLFLTQIGLQCPLESLLKLGPGHCVRLTFIAISEAQKTSSPHVSAVGFCILLTP
jgi:hypothetical protein